MSIEPIGTPVLTSSTPQEKRFKSAEKVPSVQQQSKKAAPLGLRKIVKTANFKPMVFPKRYAEGAWASDEKMRFNLAMLPHKDKYYAEIPWLEIAAAVKTRNDGQCQGHWLVNESEKEQKAFHDKYNSCN